MSKREDLIKELKTLSEPLIEEVWDFIQFLKSKDFNQKLETLLLSESSLAKDWLRPEEDEAWQDL